MHYLRFSFCIRPSVPAALRLLGSHSVGVVVLGRHCCCRFKGGSEGGRDGDGGRKGGREGGGGGALHGVRRHIHPDRHRLSVCRHPSYSTTQWKPAAAHAARRPNAPLRDAGPKRGMRQDDGMGRVDRADSRLREGGRVGQQEARKTRSGSAAARRWKAQLQNETNCAPASCRRRRRRRRRRLPPNRCARTPLAAPRRHAQHKGEASNLHKLRPKYDPEGAGPGGSGVRELRRSCGGSYR